MLLPAGDVAVVCWWRLWAVVFVHHLLVVLGVCRLCSLSTIAIVVRSCSFIIAIVYRRWLDDVAHPVGGWGCLLDGWCLLFIRLWSSRCDGHGAG